jgi:GNAT superfamily N-acetyltransferase
MDPFEIQWAGLIVEVELLARHAPGGSLMQRPGIRAAVLPGTPEASIMNVAITDAPDQDPGDLTPIRQGYVDAGIAKWGLWTDARNETAAARARTHGMVLDSTPRAMVADLQHLSHAEAPPRTTTDLGTVGRVNDLAYGQAEPKLAPALADVPPTVLTYASPDHDSVAIAYDNGTDTCVWFVATLPEARRRGLATQLLKRLLLDARDRGQQTASLQASAAGAPLYEQLGFADIGTLHFYEERLR